MFKSYASSGLVVVSALAASMLFPISASAVPFTITSTSTFDCVTPPVGLSCAPTVLKWRTPDSPLSSLTITDLTPPLLINSGDPARRITQLTHDNVIIPTAFSYLRKIDNTVTLQAGFPGLGPLLVNDSNSIDINFTETVNSAPCAFPTPASSVCDDFFDFTASSLAPIPFSQGGLNYLLIFGLDTGAGAFFDGIIGNRIYTAESATSDLFVTAKIIRVDVPEPMTLALLGLGLLGIGFTTRQRKM